MVLLESEYWRLCCDPGVGAQWLSAEVRKNKHWHSVVPDCRPETLAQASAGLTPHSSTCEVVKPLTAANFHMIPYSNRIRDGKFTFLGETIALANSQSHAIHGALRKLPWQVIAQDSSSLTCAINSADHQQVNWPWPIEATVEQSVDGTELRSHLTLWNRGDSPMPAGMGWHPYFLRQVNGSEPTLTLPVTAAFPDHNGDCLPDGAVTPLPPELDFRQARTLDGDQFIDACLSGLNGTCIIDWRNAGIRLLMQASEICRYLILYNPNQPYFAVEPVTNANDAFNLASQGIASGTQVVEPGGSLSASLSLQVQTQAV